MLETCKKENRWNNSSKIKNNRRMSLFGYDFWLYYIMKTEYISEIERTDICEYLKDTEYRSRSHKTFKEGKIRIAEWIRDNCISKYERNL